MAIENPALILMVSKGFKIISSVSSLAFRSSPSDPFVALTGINSLSSQTISIWRGFIFKLLVRLI